MNVDHSRWHHPASLVCLLALVFAQPATARQNAPVAPPLTPDEIQIYESFRAWIGSQPKDVQDAADDVVYQRYAAVLRTQGKSEQEATAAIASLKSIGDRAEIERWNRILTSPQPRFNTAPNAFLVAVTTGLKPGRSLDVGMGQGRNTIHLAQRGWESVGVDPADRAVAAAQEEAPARGQDCDPRRACGRLRLGHRRLGPHRAQLCWCSRLRAEGRAGPAAPAAWSWSKGSTVTRRRPRPSVAPSCSIRTSCCSSFHRCGSSATKTSMRSATSESSRPASCGWRR